MNGKPLTLASTQWLGEGDWNVVFQPNGMSDGGLYTDSLGGDAVREVWQFPDGSEPAFIQPNFDTTYVSAGGDPPTLQPGWKQVTMDIDPQDIGGTVPTPGSGGKLYQASSISNGSVNGKAWLYRKNTGPGKFTDSWCFQQSFSWGQPGVSIELRPIPGDNNTWADKANNSCNGGQTATTTFSIPQ